MELLESVASALVSHSRGILAADESIATMSTRLAAAGVAPTEENRRACREMLVTTPGLSGGISGVILCDETLRQRLGDGRPFPAALGDLGLLPGIKVDKGTRPLAGAPGEVVTEGLDGPHSLAQCATAMSLVLLEVFSELRDYGARLAGVVLKPNMAMPGSDAGAPAPADEVAEATVSALGGVPFTTAGVAFLSGGQRPEHATENLAAMQRLPHIWPLTFSFGRALVRRSLVHHPHRWGS